MSYTVIATRRKDAPPPANFPNDAEPNGVFRFVSRAGFITDDPERACAFSFRVDAEEYRDKLASGRAGAEYEYAILNILF